MRHAIRFAAVALVLIALPSAALAQINPPPKVDLVATTEPLSAAEQLKKFHLPPGFEIQLVAAEPEIRKPINLNFDSAGRLYATQSEEYPYPAAEGAKPRDVVKRFGKFGADGRAQEVATVVDGINIPLGVLPTPEGIVVYSIPAIALYTDRDGDGLHETRKTLYDGFGTRDTHGMVNSFTWWIDGWVYACHGFANSSETQGTDGQKLAMNSGNTFRFKLDGSHIEQFTHGQVNPFGLCFDPLGNLFSADCHSSPAYQLIRGAYYPSFGKPHDGLGYGPPLMSHSHNSTGIAGVVYYAADQFPEAYRDALYIGNPVTGRINYDHLKRHGSTYEAIEMPDFLSCDDPWFRPVDIKLGPDGALYVADFYNRIIGHYEVPLDHPGRDRERGRIWRIVYRGPEKRDVPTAPDLSAATVDQLIEHLGSPNLTVRVNATHELVNRPLDDKTRQRIREVTTGDPKELRRIHALWAVERLSYLGLDEEMIETLTDDSDPGVRTHLLRVLGERPEGPHFSSQNIVVMREALRSLEGSVSRGAAEAIGLHPMPENVPHLLAAWKVAPAADTQRIHTIRVALANHLRVPKIYDKVHDAGELRFGNEDRVAEISLAIPTPQSADFVRTYLSGLSPQGKASRTAMLEHVARRLSNYEIRIWIPATYNNQQRIPNIHDIQGLPFREQIAPLRATHRGFTAREDHFIPESLTTWEHKVVEGLLNDNDQQAFKSGLELIREFRLLGYSEMLRAAAGTDARFKDLRPIAIDACVAVDRDGSVATLSEILGSDIEPMSLRQKAAQGLGSIGTDTSRAALLSQLKTAPERLAVEIATTLAANLQGAVALLSAIGEGKASAGLLHEMGVVVRMKFAKVPDLDARLAKLTAGLPPRDDRVRKLIDARRDLIVKGSHDAAAGQAAFTKHCAACHKLGGQGNKIGPELDGVGIRGLDRLLEDMLDPSRNVDQAFRQTQIVTTGGRIVQGLVLRREGHLAVLADSQGKELRIPESEIDTQTVAPLSPMPGNIADLVSERDFGNLVAYLLGQRQPPAPAAK